MIKAILGTKQEMTQRYTLDGQRLPVTRIKAGPCVVVQIKTVDKDGYFSLQLGWGEKKKRELRVSEKTVSQFKVGDQIKAGQVFKAGDEIKVTGLSRGKGFAGVMKRWGFAGGPRTHGQSDRQRAPGSIGLGTTPGRVFKGKKMPGRDGGARVTVSGLTVMAVDDEKDELLVKGLVPGFKNGLLIVKKVGKKRNFVSLLAKGEKKIKETEEAKEVRLKREKESQKTLEAAAKEKEADA